MAVHALGGLVGGIDNEGGSLQTAKIPVNSVNKDLIKKYQDAGAWHWVQVSVILS